MYIELVFPDGTRSDGFVEDLPQVDGIFNENGSEFQVTELVKNEAFSEEDDPIEYFVYLKGPK